MELDGSLPCWRSNKVPPKLARLLLSSLSLFQRAGGWVLWGWGGNSLNDPPPFPFFLPWSLTGRQPVAKPRPISLTLHPKGFMCDHRENKLHSGVQCSFAFFILSMEMASEEKRPKEEASEYKRGHTSFWSSFSFSRVQRKVG